MYTSAHQNFLKHCVYVSLEKVVLLGIEMEKKQGNHFFRSLSVSRDRGILRIKGSRDCPNLSSMGSRSGRRLGCDGGGGAPRSRRCRPWPRARRRRRRRPGQGDRGMVQTFLPRDRGRAGASDVMAAAGRRGFAGVGQGPGR
jgi:hypothetical protein